MADGPFLQYPKWLREYLRGDATTTDVLLEMLCYMNGKTQELWTTYDHLAEQTGYHRTTVIRSINKLVDLGVITKRTSSKNGRSLPNQYWVNFNNPNYVGVAGALPSSSTGATPEGSGGATQLRIRNKNKQTRKGKIDPRLTS